MNSTLKMFVSLILRVSMAHPVTSIPRSLLANLQAYQQAFSDFPSLICYAVKANSNIAILQLLAKQGAGFDIVSLGELKRVIAAGGNPEKVIFPAWVKAWKKLMRPCVLAFFVSMSNPKPEMERIAAIATQQKKIVDIMLRVNPDIDAKNTLLHFNRLARNTNLALNLSDVVLLYEKIKSLSSLRLVGIGAHIGSQITDLAPFLQSMDFLLTLKSTLQELGADLQYVNIGGGLGITYHHRSTTQRASLCHGFA